MIELQGKYANAKIFTDNIEKECISQIYSFLNNHAFDGLKIRIMPDCHVGTGAVIGYTSTIKDKVIPNIVGVDIGCGVRVAKLKEKDIDFAKLDNVIRTYIPNGIDIRQDDHPYVNKLDLEKLKCKNSINMLQVKKSIGTLGGGNHFIEVDKDSAGNLYLVVHTGSRKLGTQVAEHYQSLAYLYLKKNLNKDRVNVIKEQLIKEGRIQDIQAEIEKLPYIKINKELAYLMNTCRGNFLDDYLHDIDIAQKYSSLNRKAIIDTIVSKMGLTVVDEFESIHNYIDVKNKIIRKGAISAQKGEKVIIPISMKDGAIIGTGKGNSDWNYSAPHGAGRVLSRSKASEMLTMEMYEESMKGIWTTSVNKNTLDECCYAYKPLEAIVNNIGDTVEINEIIKPVYNFKSSNESLTALFMALKKKKNKGE